MKLQNAKKGGGNEATKGEINTLQAMMIWRSLAMWRAFSSFRFLAPWFAIASLDSLCCESQQPDRRWLIHALWLVDTNTKRPASRWGDWALQLPVQIITIQLGLVLRISTKCIVSGLSGPYPPLVLLFSFSPDMYKMPYLVLCENVVQNAISVLRENVECASGTHV